jgi:HEAT repeat protein
MTHIFPRAPDVQRKEEIMMVPCRKCFVHLVSWVFFSMVVMIPWSLYAVEDLGKIRKDLTNTNYEVRQATLEKLRNARDEKTIALLMEVLSTREERTPVKMTAIQLLGEAGDPRAIEVLLPIFNDVMLNWECPALKSYTAIALGSFGGDKRVVDALIIGVDDGELLTREASVQSLGRIGSRKAVPRLIQALNDEHVSMRLSAIKALGDIGDPQAIPDIKRIAEREQDSVVKGQAEMALEKLQNGSGKN